MNQVFEQHMTLASLLLYQSAHHFFGTFPTIPMVFPYPASQHLLWRRLLPEQASWEGAPVMNDK